MIAAPSITVVTFGDFGNPQALANHIRKVQGACVVVLPPEGFGSEYDAPFLMTWFSELRALHADRSLILATKHTPTVKLARSAGWQAVTSVSQLKTLLERSPMLPMSLRVFSPSFWRQHIRTRLQYIGLLSLPKLRIWILLLVSVAVFLFAFLRLLPSCTIRLEPNVSTENYTTNVYLASSGAELTIPVNRIRNQELVPLTVRVHRAITFDGIGKNFTGSNAELSMTIFNDSDEVFSLRKGTRFINQAGMIFKLYRDVILPAKSHVMERAIADPLDLYGEIVGARGNVPAGLKWEIPGLDQKQRSLIYGRNEHPAKNGATSFVSSVKKEDIIIARKKLEQELLASAKELVEEERADRNRVLGTSLVPLKYDVLTSIAYENFNLSEDFIGQNISSIPVEGDIVYTVLLYDDTALLDMMKAEILSHVSVGKEIVEGSLSKENLDIRIVPPWDDDFRWVKITADLTYNEKFILSSHSPAGAMLGKSIRDNVAGKPLEDALRIVKNLPEVSHVSISLWPPWNDTLPTIPSNISVFEEEE